MIKKSIYEKIRFPENMRYGEDGIFYLYAFQFCSKMICTTERLYNYLIYSDSASHGFREDLITELNKDLHEIIYFVETFKRDDSVWDNAKYIRRLTNLWISIRGYYLHPERIQKRGYLCCKWECLNAIKHSEVQAAFYHSQKNLMSKKQRMQLFFVKHRLLKFIILYSQYNN